MQSKFLPVLHWNYIDMERKIICHTFMVDKIYLNTEILFRKLVFILVHNQIFCIETSYMHFWTKGTKFLLLKLYTLFQSKNFILTFCRKSKWISMGYTITYYVIMPEVWPIPFHGSLKMSSSFLNPWLVSSTLNQKWQNRNWLGGKFCNPLFLIFDNPCEAGLPQTAVTEQRWQINSCDQINWK